MSERVSLLAMNDQKQKRNPAILPIALAFIAGAFGLYLYSMGPPLAGSGAAVNSSFKAIAKGPMAAFLVKADRPALPALSFKDGTGAALSLENWKGRVVLINLWATWCAPCRKEMPALAELQKQLGSADFEVVAISVDLKGTAASSAYLKETGADNLGLYIDETTKTLDDLQGLGLPLTVLVDRKGHEIGRLLGPAEWTSEEARALVKAALAEAP
jgi:thiol-disulfide isomerase/thioredoxin